jgi:hypothetical protein
MKINIIDVKDMNFYLEEYKNEANETCIKLMMLRGAYYYRVLTIQPDGKVVDINNHQIILGGERA